MSRQRKTWKQAEQDKTASPPPQMPAVDRTEGPSSPAYYPDPPMDKYEKGDTSAWAEDPHKPMEPESPPPAMPGNLTTEKLTHPATSEFQKKPETPEQAAAEGGGGGKKQASLKEMAEQRANLCVRIAAALMPGADAGAVENKALELMDLEDAQLTATANTLKVLAGEEEEDEELEEEFEIEGGKKAAAETNARLAKLETSMTKMVKAMTHFFGMEGDEDGMSDKELMAYLMAEDMDGDGVDQNSPDYGYTEKSSEQDEFDRGEESEGTEMADDGDEEAMLKAMLEEMDEEMGMTASAKSGSEVIDVTEPLAKGSTIQSGEGGNVNPDEYAPTPVVAQSDGSDKVGDPTPNGGKKARDTGAAEMDIEITATGTDPMGLMGDKEASADDELMQLYADLDLPKAAGQEEKEEAEEEPADAGAGTDEKAEEDDVEFGSDDEGKEGGKKKADLKLKPQPKTASTGVQTLGNVAGMQKAAADEMDQLSKLWESAPDVSSVFGITPTR